MKKQKIKLSKEDLPKIILDDQAKALIKGGNPTIYDYEGGPEPMPLPDYAY